MLVQRFTSNDYGDAFTVHLTEREAEDLKKLPKEIEEIEDKEFFLKEEAYKKTIENLIEKIRPKTDKQLGYLDEKYKEHTYSIVIFPSDMPGLLILLLELIVLTPITRSIIQSQNKIIQLMEDQMDDKDELIEILKTITQLNEILKQCKSMTS